MEEDTYVLTSQHDPDIHASQEDLNFQHESLKNQLWYHGSIAREEAERRITINGSFLVRNSNSSPGDFVVTTKWNGYHHHIFILRDYNSIGQVVYKFESKEHNFPTVVELIKFYKESQLPFAVHTEAALYKPCSIHDIPKTRTEKFNSNDNSKLYRSMPSWFSPELRRQYKQRSAAGMHRYASEHALADRRALQVQIDLNEEVENSPQSPLQTSGRFKSLFDLDINESDSHENSSENVNCTDSSYCHTDRLKPLKPPIHRSSAFMGNAKFHSSLGERFHDSSMTSLDSDVSDYPNYNRVSEFSEVQNNNVIIPDRKKKNSNITKGRYLEMTDRTMVPIRNNKVWNDISPTSPLLENKTPPCTQEFLSGDPNLEPTYIDMSNNDRFLANDDLSTPVINSKHLGEQSFNLDDIYAVVTETSDETVERNMFKFGNERSQAHVLCWQFMICNCKFIDWNNIGNYVPKNWSINQAMDKNALPRVRELLNSSNKSDRFSIAMTVAKHLTLEDARILLNITWPSLPPELSKKINDDWTKKNVPGITNGFQLCLLPDSVSFKNDIKHRYATLTRFVITTVVTEGNIDRRISLFHTWLRIAECLLNTHRNYFSLQAVLNGIFSKQIQSMSHTVHRFTASSPANLKLYSDLQSVHNRGTSSSTCLSTCLPDVGKLVDVLEQSNSRLTNLWNTHISCVSSRDDLHHIISDLDSCMSFLLSATSWHSVRADELWLQEIARQEESDPWWQSFLRTETQIAFLFGPKTPDIPSLPSLCAKLDKALLLFAEQTELRIKQS